MRILILEDDFFQRKLMARLLISYGECDVAATGSDAVEAFRRSLENNRTYDLIFLDIMVPGMDGQKVLRAIRDLEQERNIEGLSRSKVVMVTALGDKHNVTTAYKENCDAYLVKPYEEAKLVDTIKKLGLLPSAQS